MKHVVNYTKCELDHCLKNRSAGRSSSLVQVNSCLVLIGIYSNAHSNRIWFPWNPTMGQRAAWYVGILWQFSRRSTANHLDSDQFKIARPMCYDISREY